MKVRLKSPFEITREMEELAQQLADSYRNEFRFRGARYFRKLMNQEGEGGEKAAAATVKAALRDEALRVACQGHSRWSGGFSVTNLSEQVRHEVAASVASQDYFGMFRVTLEEIHEWCKLLDMAQAQDVEAEAS